MPVAILRCGNIYGGGDLNFDLLIPGAIKAALNGESLLLRSDGTFKRDYLHVSDAVTAYLTVAEGLGQRDLRGEAFNFGNEEPLTVLNVVERILGLMDLRQLSPIIQNTATGEIRDQYLSTAKAREQLGWRPKVGLDAGLQETIAWYRAYFAERQAVRFA